MSKSVFVSHAVADRKLAAEVVALIEEGVGVPEAEIFCSSLKGYGIPTGQNFVTFIKAQMLEPKVVVLLLTPSYFASAFCMAELGAAWVKSHVIFPILVEPLQYSDVNGVLLGTQVIRIDDDIGYNELRDTLHAEVACKQTSGVKWDTKRRAFLKAIAPLLAKIELPSTVTAAEHEMVVSELVETRTELDAYEEQLRALRDRLEATEALKDRAAVVNVQAQFSAGTTNLLTELDELTDEIKAYRSVLKGAAVMLFVLSDHYDKPYSIDWMGDRTEFEAAARYNYIDVEDGERVNWSNPKMKALGKSLRALDDFVAEHGRALAKAEDDAPLDPSGQDFWEYHYDL